MRYLLFTLWLINSGLILSQPPQLEWQTAIGGYALPATTSEVFSRIEPTSDGGFIMSSTLSSDYRISKLDGLGNIAWQISLGGSGSDIAGSIIENSNGNFVVCGATESNNGDVSGNHGGWDYWVLEIDSTGNIIWQRCYGGSADDHAQSIIQTNEGGYLVVGKSWSINGDVSGNNGQTDYWIVKIDEFGDIQWEQSYGGSGADHATSCYSTPQGEFVIAGYSQSVDGDVTDNHSTFSDFWIIKIDMLGSIIWQKCFGSIGYEQPYEITGTNDGGYVVAGYTFNSAGDNGDVIGTNSGSSDYWIIKLNNNGDLIWQKCLGGGNWDRAHGIDATSDGGFIVSGEYNANTTFGDATDPQGLLDCWIVKLNSVGIVEWDKIVGGTQNDSGHSVRELNPGEYICTGSTNSSDGNITIPYLNNQYFTFKLNEPVVNNLSCTDMTELCFDSFNNQLLYQLDQNVQNTGTLGACIIGGQGDQDWHYFEITENGDVSLEIGFVNDCDYAVFGPFNSYLEAVSSCNVMDTTVSQLIVDCSYSTNNPETPFISGAIVGEIYVLVVSNYAPAVDNYYTISNVSTITNNTLCQNCIVEDTVLYTGCIGDNYTYTFNGITYDESNPFGIDSLNNANGCDTIRTIDLNFLQCNPIQPFTSGMQAFVNGSVINALNPLDTGFVDVCLGDSIMFVANPNFYNSLENTGIGYSQDVNANIDFSWNIGGVNYPSNDTIFYTPNSQNGVLVELGVTDQYDVYEEITSKIRVGMTPNFSGVYPVDDTVCIGENTQIFGGANGQGSSFDIPGGSFGTSGVNAGLTYLPDGSGQQYQAPITISGFPSGSTVQSAQDLNQVCLTMEHSYAGDLEIWLQCPNGTTVALVNSYSPGAIPGGTSGTNTYLGDPIDDFGGGGPGEGWEYCFSSVFNDIGPMTQNWGNTIPAPNFGNNGPSVDPSNTYQPETSFAGFAGCPVNGNWTIFVQDNLSVDDGYIFEWGLDFDGNVSGIPNYQNTLDSAWWTPNTTIIENLGDSAIIVQPGLGGDTYTFNVMDNFGCVHDTTIQVFTIEPKITVFNDITNNCSQDVGEFGIEGVNLYIEPGNIIISTNVSGQAFFGELENGSYTVTIDTTNLNWSVNCGVTQSFDVTNDGNGCFELELGLTPENPCTEPDVTIFAQFFRRCTPDQIIDVLVTNSTTATAPIINGTVEVILDPLIIVTDASLPYNSLGNNTFSFGLDTILPGESQSFNLIMTLSCDAYVGQTLCMEANLTPVAPCVLDTIPSDPVVDNGIGGTLDGLPEPCTLPWDQSSLSVEGWCDNDTVYFSVTNTGDPGGGDMECYSPVWLTVDGVVTDTDSLQIQGGETVIYGYPGTGQTFILNASQHPLHPGNSQPNAHVELCGDTTNWTPDLVNDFPQDDADPVIDIYCPIVSAPEDPNDKIGYPIGQTSENYIQANQQLQYVIRFQNVGTDTAFTVVVLDTLDLDLNIFTVAPGVSSHSYDFRMYGPRVLEWTFENIQLPDSTTNPEGSNGYLTFHVDQVPDLAPGTVINNDADIYFDYELPITTNTTVHKIFEGFVDVLDPTVSIENYIAGEVIVIYPNPTTNLITIQSESVLNNKFKIYDQQGREVMNGKLTGNNTEVSLGKLSRGTYTIQVEGNYKPAVIVKD